MMPSINEKKYVQLQEPYLTMDPESLTDESLKSFKRNWQLDHPEKSFDEIGMSDEYLRKFLAEWMGTVYEMQRQLDKHGEFGDGQAAS